MRRTSNEMKLIEKQTFDVATRDVSSAPFFRNKTCKFNRTAEAERMEEGND